MPRRPESVLVVVYADNAEILLLKRQQPFSFWQSVTGSLEAGESAQDAARRELAEETGLREAGLLLDSGVTRRFDIDARWLARYAAGVTENTEHEWRYRLDSPLDIVLDRNEHSEFRWCSIDAAIEAVWSWTNKEALRSLKAALR